MKPQMKLFRSRKMVAADYHRKDLMTLRQEIEEILREIVGSSGNIDHFIDIYTDRICEAIKKRVEEMPKVEVYGQLGHCAVEKQFDACKSYLLKELEK